MKGWLRALLVLVVLAVVGLAWLGWGRHQASQRPAATAVAAATLADPALIARGEYLAAAGDCAGCHTAQGGAPYAGGRTLATPFGDVTAPNLTPDVATGLGGWRFEDFWNALHEGIGRDGRALYPVFPYTAYTRVDRGDALALFAYLRALRPVRHATPAPLLRFPYGLRLSLATWRALYFRAGVFMPDSRRSAQWNRGAYLVQGLGHCNECHAPRDSLGGLPQGPTLTGGQIPMQNWYAPDLGTRTHGGLEGWSAQDIAALLKTGQSAKGAAFGPMAEVVAQSTQHLRDEDLQAVAAYLRSLPPRPAPIESRSAPDIADILYRGGKLYAQQCEACHGKDGQGIAGVYPPLDRSFAVTEPSGINAIRMVLLGGFAPVTQANPRPYSMPPFAQQLDDADVAAVVSYVRQAWSNTASAVSERDVAAYRHTPVE